MSRFWQNTRVLVTGGAGFIGSHVVEQLIRLGANVTVLDNLQNSSLKNLSLVRKDIQFIQGDCKDARQAELACKNQTIVMNLAARVGGIAYNRSHQGTMLSDNLLIGSTMIEAARKAEVHRFLVVSSACVYPRDCMVPTPESEGFRGEPEPTNGAYGWAKRMGELLGKYYHEEFNMAISVVRPYNCYGPRDTFDTETSHVIPALIKKVLGDENPVIVWGSGSQTRAFLYVEDLALGMIHAVEKQTDAAPINIGTDEEVTIADVVNRIIKIAKVNKRVQFDTTKPDGSPRRNCDNSLAKEKLQFVAHTKLTDGLQKTISWYSHL